MLTLSLPRDTPLALPGGVWELLGTKWTRTEEPRWWYDGDRIRADYTDEEAAIAVGMLVPAQAGNGVSDDQSAGSLGR